MTLRGDVPLVVVLGGPNGAGKTTTGPALLRGALAVRELVNADAIALGLSQLQPESVAVAAGRVMVRRMRQLAAERQDFAFETTLATRSFAPWLARLRADGYRAHLSFLSLPSADLAVRRVAERVQAGGHDVPEAVVRRRFAAGLRNLFAIYQPLFDTWQVFDNSSLAGPRLLASGRRREWEQVEDPQAWQSLRESSR